MDIVSISFDPIKTFGPLIERYGYAAVFGAIFLEDFGLPVPGETILIAAAAAAAQMRMNIFIVFFTATCAAITGDSVGFAIGYFGGRRLLLLFGGYIFLTPEKLTHLQRFFHRNGGKIVIVARFVEGLRQFNGIVSGSISMPYWRFLIFNVIGSILWVGWWCSIAFYFGQHLALIFAIFHKIWLVILGAAVVVITVIVLSKLKRHS